MSAKSLLEPIVNNGIKDINYFQGRVLSAEDLREQEQANRRHRRQLGRVFGSGVVGGLEISVENTGGDNTPPVVRIHKGMGINREGELLELPVDYVDLQLSRDLPSVSPDIKVFNDCAPLDTDTLVPSGAGLYILVMSPAARYEDFAPKSGLQSQGIASGCGRRYVVEGVQYRLVQFDPTLMPGISEQTRTLLSDDLLNDVSPVSSSQIDRLSLLRNVVAHICFGTETDSEITSPPESIKTDSPLAFDRLFGTGQGLESCDIPLALIYWTLDGITFVDHWSVRRTVPGNCDDGIYPDDPVKRQIGDAMMRQFREHMGTLARQTRDNISLSQTGVDQLFRYLPATGAVAIAGSGSATGFFRDDFFGGRESGTPTIIPYAQVVKLYDQAVRHKPIEVARTDIIQLYWMRENLEATSAGTANQRWLFFAGRHLHGFRETDDTWATLEQTWKSYNEILRKQVLIPATASDEALPVRTALQADIQATIQYAMTQAASAAARELNRAAVFRVFRDLYALQNTFAGDLTGTFEGDEGLEQRDNFSSQLKNLLDASDTGDGSPGLLPALDADAYQQVLHAQQAINALVGSWSGQFVFGSVAIRHNASPDGEQLVPGSDTTFTFEFLLIGFIDKRTDVNLAAEIANSPSGTWGNTIEIHDPESGTVINTVTLNPQERRFINVVVQPPADAQVDEDVILAVSASIPPPTGKQWENQLMLTTAVDSGEPVVWQLQLTKTQPGGDLRAFTAPPAPSTLNFIFQSEFIAARNPTSASVTFIVDCTFDNSSRDDWGVSITHESVMDTPLQETTPGHFEFTYTLDAGQMATPTTVTIQIPGGSASTDRTCTFTARVEAEIVDPESGETVIISDAQAPFSVTNPSGA